MSYAKLRYSGNYFDDKYKTKNLRHNNKMWRKFGVRWCVVLVVLFCRGGEEELVNTLIVKYLFLSQDKQLMLFFHLFWKKQKEYNYVKHNQQMIKLDHKQNNCHIGNLTSLMSRLWLYTWLTVVHEQGREGDAVWPGNLRFSIVF